MNIERLKEAHDLSLDGRDFAARQIILDVIADLEKKETAEQPAQQEPVATVESVATVVSESGNPNVLMSWWHEPALPVGTKLYTSPPARRTWVGLTDEEIDRVTDTQWARNNHKPIYVAHRAFARAIEAKLREKNT